MSHIQSKKNLLQDGINYVFRPNYQKAKIKNLREQSPFQNGKRNRDFINPSLTSNMIFYNQKNNSTISNPHMLKKANMPRGYDLNNYVVTDLEAVREEKYIPVTGEGKRSQYTKSRINLKKTLKRNVSSSQRSLHRSRSKNSINNISIKKRNVVKKSQRSISRNRSMKRNKSDNNISYSNKLKVEEDLISKKSKKSGLSKRSRKSNLSKAKERLLKKKNNQNEINDLIKLNQQNDKTKYQKYLGKSNKINKPINYKENSRYNNNNSNNQIEHQDGHSYHYHNNGHLGSHQEDHSHHHHKDEISNKNRSGYNYNKQRYSQEENSQDYNREDYSQNGFSKNGGVQAKGYREGHKHGKNCNHDGLSHNEEHVNNQKGHNNNGHSQNGYNNDGHSQNGYSKNGHSQNGYSKNGHSQNGYSQNDGNSHNGHIHQNDGNSHNDHIHQNDGHSHNDHIHQNDGHSHNGHIHQNDGHSHNRYNDEGHSQNDGRVDNYEGHGKSYNERVSGKSESKNVYRNSEFTGVSGSNVSDPGNLICDKCINQKIYKDKVMSLEQQRLMDEEFANRVNKNLKLQLEKEREENDLKKKIFNEAINNQIEDLKKKKRLQKEEKEAEERKLRSLYKNNQSELDRVAEERRKKNNFIKDLKNQINKKREIEFLKREEDFQIDRETPNVLIDDGFRRDQREAMKEYYKNNLINQIIEKEEEKEGAKKRQLMEDEQYRLELDKIRAEEKQKRLDLELQKKKIFMNEINKQLKDNKIKNDYKNELNRKGDQDYWKKIDHDQKVYMENMFRKKQMMNGYIQNLGDQIERDNKKKDLSLYERKKKTNTTLCMGKKPSKCYNCVVCRAKYPLKMLNKKKRYKKKK